MICLSDHGHPSGCEVVPCCGFGCLFLMTKDVEHLFMCSLIIHISTLEDIMSSWFGCFSPSFSPEPLVSSCFLTGYSWSPESQANNCHPLAVFCGAWVPPTPPSMSKANPWCSNSWRHWEKKMWPSLVCFYHLRCPLCCISGQCSCCFPSLPPLGVGGRHSITLLLKMCITRALSGREIWQCLFPKIKCALIWVQQLHIGASIP